MQTTGVALHTPTTPHKQTNTQQPTFFMLAIAKHGAVACLTLFQYSESSADTRLGRWGRVETSIAWSAWWWWWWVGGVRGGWVVVKERVRQVRYAKHAGYVVCVESVQHSATIFEGCSMPYSPQMCARPCDRDTPRTPRVVWGSMGLGLQGNTHNISKSKKSSMVMCQPPRRNWVSQRDELASPPARLLAPQQDDAS